MDKIIRWIIGISVLIESFSLVTNYKGFKIEEYVIMLF